MGKFLNYTDLLTLLPYSGVYRLLDRVQIADDGKLTAIKCVTYNERYFIGHFPNYPIMPGVLQLEAMKQLCEVAIRDKSSEPIPYPIVLKKATRIKFRKPTLPGDRLKIEATPMPEEGENVFYARCQTANGVVSEGKLELCVRTEEVPRTMPEDFDELDRSDDDARGIQNILELMPHRWPFLLVDYIKSEKDVVIAVKNVTGAESFFDSCKSYCALPEPLLCEITAQTGCSGILALPANKGKIGFFMGIDHAEFYAGVYPGDRLIMKTTVPAVRSRFGKGSCEAFVGTKKIADIAITFALVDSQN